MEGLDTLTHFFSYNNYLDSLSLANCNISAENLLPKICDGLNRNNSIKYLDLSGNNIGDT